MKVKSKKAKQLFENYLVIQLGGACNMFDTTCTGLSMEDTKFVISNYEALLKEYPQLKDTVRSGLGGN